MRLPEILCVDRKEWERKEGGVDIGDEVGF